MTSPAYDIAVQLESLGLGTIAAKSGWSIAVSREPQNPANVITIYDTGGEIDTDEQNVLYPTFQIRVRASTYLESYNKHRDIQKWLALNGFTSDTIRYVSFKVISSIMQIDVNDNNQPILVANYSAVVDAP